MTTALRPYAAYKGSGVPWLGEVPEHWDLVPNRAVMRLKKEVVGDSSCDYVLLSLTKQGIIARDMENPTGKFPGSFDTYQVVRPGDLVFCLFDIDETPRAVGLSSLNGMVTGAYTVFACRDHEVREFVYLLYLALDNGKLLKPLYSGLRKVITKTSFLSAKLPLPPRPELLAIVRYLQYTERIIRRYIRAKQKLIKLLEEQRQAIIEHAVTHGLDPRVRLADSPLVWFRGVPEHWELVPFKRRVGFQEGPGIMAEDFRDAGVPLLRISCLRGDIATLEGCDYLDPDMVARRWKHFGVREGDYLLSASASTGSVALTTRALMGSIPYTGIIRLWPVSSRTFMPFVKLFIESRAFQDQIDSAKSGVGIEHFGPTHLKRMFITLPPVAEQHDIVRRVEELIAPMADTIESVRDEIGLVREYRTRVIADVVTGKLDVREAAANLSDRIEPSESFEDEDLIAAEGEFEESVEQEAALEEVEV